MIQRLRKKSFCGALIIFAMISKNHVLEGFKEAIGCVQGGERLAEQGDRHPPEYEEGDDIDLDDIDRTYRLTAVGKCNEFIALL